MDVYDAKQGVKEREKSKKVMGGRGIGACEKKTIWVRFLTVQWLNGINGA